MKIPPGRYRHFKGRDYEVIGAAQHSESEEMLVVYRPLYGGFRLMVRPQAMFMELVEHDGTSTPRFRFLGHMTTHKLTPHQWRQARAYLLHKARPLEAARYRFHFEAGSAGEVLATLAAYKNDDGGFGHALEPDLRTPASSALATSVAIQIMDEVRAPSSHPLVQGALAYLLASFDSATQRWRIIPPEAEDAPRAFWWMDAGLDDRFDYFWLNPRAELLGAFWQLAGPARVPWLASLTTRIVEEIEGHDKPVAGNDLLCALRLAATPALPDALRTRLLARLRQDVVASVETRPERWQQHGVRPLDVALTPDSAYAGLLAEPLQANLDFLIDSQGADGAWMPTWSWAPLDAVAWGKAAREWKGVLTLNALRALHDWGRVAR